jgi:hypothetical protein
LPSSFSQRKRRHDGIYVDVFCYFILALAGTIAWTVIERGRPVSPRVIAAFRTYLRFAMAMILLGYGFAKVPPSQFSTPGPELFAHAANPHRWGCCGPSWAFRPLTMFAGGRDHPDSSPSFQRTALGALLGA